MFHIPPAPRLPDDLGSDDDEGIMMDWEIARDRDISRTPKALVTKRSSKSGSWFVPDTPG